MPVEKGAEQLYLRGTFTMWGYKEEYKLQKVRRQVFSAAAQLQAGQNYEFMFSAKDASKDNANCGYADAKQKLIKVGSQATAKCSGVVLQNFIFKPSYYGVYEFFLDFSRQDKPIVYVEKAY